MMYALYVVGGLWVLVNLIVAIKYSLREMANDLWSGQKWYGKICANLFYCLAWAVCGLLTAVVCVLGWVSFSIYYVGKFAVAVFKPLYAKAIKLNL